MLDRPPGRRIVLGTGEQRPRDADLTGFLQGHFQQGNRPAPAPLRGADAEADVPAEFHQGIVQVTAKFAHPDGIAIPAQPEGGLGDELGSEVHSRCHVDQGAQVAGGEGDADRTGSCGEQPEEIRGRTARMKVNHRLVNIDASFKGCDQKHNRCTDSPAAQLLPGNQIFNDVIANQK